MINQDTVANLRSIVNHLKGTNGYRYFVHYFEEKRKEILEDLLKESGTLTAESLISENAKMQVYDDLINFDILLEKDINSK